MKQNQLKPKVCAPPLVKSTAKTFLITIQENIQHKTIEVQIISVSHDIRQRFNIGRNCGDNYHVASFWSLTQKNHKELT